MSGLNLHHDILLVDQRGTGQSNAYSCPKPTKPLTSKAALRAYTLACLKAFDGDMREYGTRMAADDLDAVRAALGYRQLDVIGGSYGATAAQVYMKLHPTSVRTLTLIGPSALDVPLFGRWAVNSQRALDQWAQLCDSQSVCHKEFPGWERQFGELVKAWDAHPVQIREGVTITVSSSPPSFTACWSTRARRPRSRCSSAAPPSRRLRGRSTRQATETSAVSPAAHVLVDLVQRALDWAWTRTGPWGIRFDSYDGRLHRHVPEGLHVHAETRRAALAVDVPRLRPACRSSPSSGGADPQDPITNLP